jgi:N-acetylneuraminic acid mutarotase
MKLLNHEKLRFEAINTTDDSLRIITSGSEFEFLRGFPASYPFIAFGSGTLQWYLDGSKPSFIDIDINSGLISGQYNYALFIKNDGKSSYQVVTFENFSVDFDEIGGDETNAWSISSGNLPTGLSIDPNTGVISGVIEGVVLASIFSSDDSVSLSWTKIDNEELVDEIIVQRHNGDLNWQTIQTLPRDSNSYTDNSPTLTSNNYYRIVYNNSSVEYTNVEASIYVGGISISNLIITQDPNTKDTINLSWTVSGEFDISYVDSIQVLITSPDDVGVDDDITLSNTATNYSDISRTFDQTYNYTVNLIKDSTVISSDLGSIRLVDFEVFSTVGRIPISNTGVSVTTMHIIGDVAYTVGGYNTTGIRTVQRFDLTNNTQLSNGANHPVSTEVYAHVSVKVGTDIYVWGGGNPANNTMYKYDTVSNSWTTLASGGTIVRYVKGVYDGSDKIYILGGWNGPAYVNQWFCYNISTNDYTTSLTNPPITLYETNLVFYNNEIYAFGTQDGATYLDGEIYKYNIAEDSWSIHDTLPKTNSRSGVYHDGSGKVYLFQGTSNSSGDRIRNIYYYNIDDRVWYDIPHNLETPHDQCSSDIWNGKIYTYAGTQRVGGVSTRVGRFYTLSNTPVNFVRRRESMETNINDNATAIVGDIMYIIGGFIGSSTTGSTALNTVKRFDLSTHKFISDGSTMPVGLKSMSRCHSTAVVGTRIYIYGGRNTNDSEQNTIYYYDTSDNTWYTPANASFGTPKGYVSIIAVGTDVYLVGGGDDSSNGTSNELLKFDTVGESWTTLEPLPLELQHQGLVNIGDYIYTLGGYVGSTASSTDAVYRYSISGDSWELYDNMSGEYVDNSGAILEGDKIFITGGLDRSNATTVSRKSIISYDYLNKKTERLPDTSSVGSSDIHKYGNKYISKSSIRYDSGSSSYSSRVYEFSYNTIKTKEGVLDQFWDDGIDMVGDTDFLVVSNNSLYHGLSQTNSETNGKNIVREFDLIHRTQPQTSDYTTTRHSTGASSLDSLGSASLGDYIYLFSGQYEQNAVTKFNTVTKTFTSLGNYGDSVRYLTAVSDGSRYVYFLGGRLGNSTNSTQTIRLDTTNDSFNTMSPIPVGQSVFDAVLIGNYIYTMASLDNNNSIIYRYDIALNTWEEYDELDITPRNGYAMFHYNGDIYIIFGRSNIDTNNTVSTYYRYDYQNRLVYPIEIYNSYEGYSATSAQAPDGSIYLRSSFNITGGSFTYLPRTRRFTNRYIISQTESDLFYTRSQEGGISRSEVNDLMKDSSKLFSNGSYMDETGGGIYDRAYSTFEMIESMAVESFLVKNYLPIITPEIISIPNSAGDIYHNDWLVTVNPDTTELPLTVGGSLVLPLKHYSKVSNTWQDMIILDPIDLSGVSVVRIFGMLSNYCRQQAGGDGDGGRHMGLKVIIDSVNDEYTYFPPNNQPYSNIHHDIDVSGYTGSHRIVVQAYTNGYGIWDDNIYAAHFFMNNIQLLP